MSAWRAGLFSAYLGTLWPVARAFAAALENPAEAQRGILERLLVANRNSAFGREHRFDSIEGTADFRRAVPARTYSEFEPWIERAFAGEPNVLTTESIRLFERTSGSSAKNKLIPFTASFLNEVNRSTSTWLFRTFAARPSMIGGRSYYSISPNLRERETSPGGVPIGMEDDRDYLGRWARPLIGAFMAVPAEIANIREPDRWRRATLSALLEAHDLRFVSIWSPTFWLALLEHLQNGDPELERTLSKGARERLSAARQSGWALNALWPELKMISLWTDGPSHAFAELLRPLAHGIELQAKALIATEGVVSVPGFGGPGSPLAVASHYLEFVHLPSGDEVFAHELKEGERYSPLLTTGSGLCRYRLQDVVECVGREKATPRIQFIGKLEGVSDLCGEKISVEQAREALREATIGLNLEWRQLVARRAPQPRYTALFSGPDARRASHCTEQIDALLRRNMHYDYARKLGQLSGVEALAATDLRARYEDFCVQRGMRLGDIKFQDLLLTDDFLRTIEPT